jgi:hypothetical protein
MGAVTPEAAPAAGGERLRRRPRSPPKGVPGDGAMAAARWRAPDPRKQEGKAFRSEVEEPGKGPPHAHSRKKGIGLPETHLRISL